MTIDSNSNSHKQLTNSYANAKFWRLLEGSILMLGLVGMVFVCGLLFFWYPPPRRHTHTQAGGRKMSDSPSLDKLLLKSLGERALVKMSANWLEEETGSKQCINPCWVFSRTMWQSMSKCPRYITLIGSYCKALWLSQYIKVTWRSFRR